MNFLNASTTSRRAQLDHIFAIDATASVFFGVLSLLAPHHLIEFLGGGAYNHSVHEALRLYGCLRVACGWIVWQVRKVDDGIFRRHVCEALAACYVMQALAVLRAQLTDRNGFFNWIPFVLFSILAFAYLQFRFGEGGNLIKIYELPRSGSITFA